MSFHAIDWDSWQRRETYLHFTNEVPCTYSMCVQLRLQALQPRLKAQGYKLFPTLLYGLSKQVNRHREFRMTRRGENEVGYCDTLHPSYTVFHPETESFSSRWTAYTPSFPAFHARYLVDAQRDGEAGEPPEDGIFYVSCIPWVTFTGFHLHLPEGGDSLTPIFTIGRYQESGGDLLLPLSLQVHHAVCDGYHAARFINELQAWIDDFP